MTVDTRVEGGCLVATWDIVQAALCDNCGELSAMEEAKESGPLYECGKCGEVFTRNSSANGNHQCPSCNTMAAKADDVSCPKCEAGEIEETDAIEMDDGRLVTVDDMETELANLEP